MPRTPPFLPLRGRRWVFLAGCRPWAAPVTADRPSEMGWRCRRRSKPAPHARRTREPARERVQPPPEKNGHIQPGRPRNQGAHPTARTQLNGDGKKRAETDRVENSHSLNKLCRSRSECDEQDQMARRSQGDGEIHILGMGDGEVMRSETSDRRPRRGERHGRVPKTTRKFKTPARGERYGKLHTPFPLSMFTNSGGIKNKNANHGATQTLANGSEIGKPDRRGCYLSSTHCYPDSATRGAPNI